LSETVPANNRILQAVWQGIPDRRTSHTEKKMLVVTFGTPARTALQ